MTADASLEYCLCSLPLTAEAPDVAVGSSMLTIWTSVACPHDEESSVLLGTTIALLAFPVGVLDLEELTLILDGPSTRCPWPEAATLAG